VDKVDNSKSKIESNQRIEFTSETDRVYQDGGKNGNPIEIDDRIRVIGSSTMPDIVVWNPWQVKAKASVDIGETNFPKFVCIEVGCVTDSVTLDKGQTWTGSHDMSVLN
jgi:glucose-6-phosphate 1-epimerase